MVKLIRLKSDNDKLYFNNNIQSDLVLKPNSKIGLQNVSFEKKEQNIVIDNENKEITFDNGGGDVSVDLTEQIYNKNNFKDFKDDMNLQCNSGLNSSEPTDIGIGFTCRVNNANKFKIETALAFQINPTTRFGAINVNKSDPSSMFKSTGTSAWDANIGSNALSAFDGINGCGIFRVQIGALGTTGFGFYIGLSEDEPQDMGGDFNPNKCQFLINAENSNSPYRFVDPANPTLTTSTLNPESFSLPDTDNDNDILAIEASEGKIELKIYNTSNPAGIILPGTTPQKYTGTKALYPIIGVYQAANTNFKNISYTFSQDYSEPTLTNTNIKELKENLVFSTLTPPQQDDTEQNKSFEFETSALALSLGFSQRTLSAFVDEFDFVADESIRFFDNTECYLVEALNLQFDSFDGSKGQEKRRNLLAVIQNIRDRTEPDVLFDSNSITYIDINNAFPLPLRNLQFRILNSDEGEVEVDGFSNMTILID